MFESISSILSYHCDCRGMVPAVSAVVPLRAAFIVAQRKEA